MVLGDRDDHLLRSELNSEHLWIGLTFSNHKSVTSCYQTTVPPKHTK